MRETHDIMGMPVSVEVVGVPEDVACVSREDAFDLFRAIDERFSTYKQGSEISRINRNEVLYSQYSADMRSVFAWAEETKQRTHGYFDIRKPDGSLDPSGIVKGWAIQKVAELLHARGHENFYVEAGGDIQTSGTNAEGTEWRIGIRNPFVRNEIVKIVHPRGRGLATSGIAIRGNHIYDPHTKRPVETNLASITVIGPNVYEADRFATAAFAMGRGGMTFIEHLNDFECYAIDMGGTATMTSGFERYTHDTSDR